VTTDPRAAADAPQAAGLQPASGPLKAAYLAYGVLCYVLFLAAFLYSIGFVGDWLVPKSIDSGAPGESLGSFVVDALLLAAFALPHSVMARPAFKNWWTRFVAPTVERSTYVLVSSLLLAILMWQWQPLPGVVWGVESPIGRGVLLALFWTGWSIVFLSTFLIDHFDLFGLRQAYLYARGRPYTPPPFRKRLFYRFVRHPLLLGFLVAFWSTPRMTIGHLLFAAATTAYTLVAIRLEERDLSRAHGSAYDEYREQVGMLLPWPWK
jgi:protein-S-isoprenylcysteine O-methyltransferase Ste14